MLDLPCQGPFDRGVAVAGGDVGGQVLAAGLIGEVRMDVVPVVFGSGKLS